MELKKDDYYKFMDGTDHLLHLELRSFWSKGVLEQIGPSFIKDFKLNTDKFKKKSFFILVDMTEYKQPSDAAKVYIQQAMGYSFANGAVKAVEVAPKALTRMGVRDAAEKTEANHHRIQAPSVVEGLQIINNLIQEV